MLLGLFSVIALATEIKALIVYWTDLMKIAEKEQVLSDFPDIGPAAQTDRRAN
jgi:hypothetical protein